MTTLQDRLRIIIDTRYNGSQKQFADALNMNPASISKWFSGNVPRDPTLRAIAQAANVSYTWLTTGEGEMDAPAPSGLADALASLSDIALDDPGTIGVVLEALARLGPDYIRAAYDLACRFRDEVQSIQAQKKDES